MADYDLLIKNGTIVDGLRMPAFKGDIGVRNGKITEFIPFYWDTVAMVEAAGGVTSLGWRDRTAASDV